MIRALFQKSVSLVPWQLRSRIKDVPGLAAMQRYLLRRFLVGHEFIHTVDAGPARGLCYPINLPEDKGIWKGTYELEFATALSQAVHPGDVCLDIGGWSGFFGGVMALAGASRVFIFEPLPTNAARIRRMIDLNPRLRFELIEAAVSDEPSTIDFRVMPDSSMGKLATSPFQPENRDGELMRVQAISLDEWVNAQRDVAPSVIKIDVEGAELLVLRGARQLLHRFKPALFIEVHSSALAAQCGSLLRELNYEVSVLDSTKRNEETYRQVCHFIAVAKSRPTGNQTD